MKTVVPGTLVFPDELRGRLAGIELLSYSVGPQISQTYMGGVAAWKGVRTSVWSGGLLCVGAVGLLALCLPKLMTYDARTNEHAVRQRERRAEAAAAPPVPAERRPHRCRRSVDQPPSVCPDRESCQRGSFSHSRLRSRARSMAC